MRSIVAACSLGLLLLAGCGSGTGQTSQLTGRWATVASVNVAGTTALSLQQTGNTVTGTGQYSIEAGRSGTLSVSGTVSNVAVNLTFTYDTQNKAAFQGVLVDATHLNGALASSANNSSTLNLVRQ